MAEVTREAAEHSLWLIDALGRRPRSKLGALWMVLKALRHNSKAADDEDDTTPALRVLVKQLLDPRGSLWSSTQIKSKALRRLYLAQKGSGHALNEVEFVHHVVEAAVRRWVSEALHAAASVHFDEQKQAALLDAAERCMKVSIRLDGLSATKDAATSARDIAWQAADTSEDYGIVAEAAEAANLAAQAAAYAAMADAAFTIATRYADGTGVIGGRIDERARQAAADASDDPVYEVAARFAVGWTILVVCHSARASESASRCTSTRASKNSAPAVAFHRATSKASEANAEDRALAAYAETIVQILRDMRSPGCRWVDILAPKSSDMI
jgi:hypothetical protein